MSDVRASTRAREEAFMHGEEPGFVRSAVHFVSYHNAVPIGVSLLLLSGGSALAASPEIRSDVSQAVFSQQQVVQSVDNTYIVNKDLSSWAPTIQITNVTEDTDNYYVAYKMTTIDIDDYVWKDVTRPEVTLAIAKNSLNGEDLGLYVAKQLKNVSDAEIDRLKRTQEIEKQNGEQLRQVATVYSGLIGKFLDPREETLPGYVPVVPPDSSDASSTPAGNGANPAAVQQPSNGSGPLFQVLGKNPAEVPLGSGYADLGAFVTDSNGMIISDYTTTGTVDTSTIGEYTLTYSARDFAGHTGTATRKVIVYDPAKGPPIDPNTIPLVVPKIPEIIIPSSPAPTPSPAPADTTPAPTPSAPSSDSTTSTTTSNTSSSSSTTATDSTTASTTPVNTTPAPDTTATTTDTSTSTASSTTP